MASIEGLKYLPVDFRRNMTLMKEMDLLYHRLMNQIEVKRRNYYLELHLLSPQERNKKLQEINRYFKKAKGYADQKCSLAKQCYDLIDKNICELDENVSYKAIDDKLRQTTSKVSGVKNEMNEIRNCLVDSGNTETSFDIPIDPNEPTYCFCKQVSYGEMIGCDNDDCPYEWFHFSCVGLIDKPKGSWYCQACQSKL